MCPDLKLVKSRRVNCCPFHKDKKAVDEYKASIKAQLSRAGLIRGQPRINGVHPSPPPRRQPSSTTRRSTASSNASRIERSPSFTPTHRPAEVSFVGQSSYPNPHLTPTAPGERTFKLHFPRLTTSPVPPTLTYENPLTFDDTYEQPQSFFLPNTLGVDAFAEPIVSGHGLDFPLDHSRLSDYAATAQPTMHDLAMHYFNNVRQVQLLFAGDALNEVTYAASSKNQMSYPPSNFVLL